MLTPSSGIGYLHIMPVFIVRAAVITVVISVWVFAHRPRHSATIRPQCQYGVIAGLLVEPDAAKRDVVIQIGGAGPHADIGFV